MSSRKGKRLPKFSGLKTLTAKQKAGRILNCVASGTISPNHRDAIWASNVVGFDKALKIITTPHKDCLQKRGLDRSVQDEKNSARLSVGAFLLYSNSECNKKQNH
jgi:hypothetical protein